MSMVNLNIVSKYLQPARPIRALVQRMDTVFLKITLKDEDSNPVDLTGCAVTIAATDDAKTMLYTGNIQSASAGTVNATVQPDVVGNYSIEARVSNETSDVTFWLGSFVVAHEDEDSGPTPTIASLTDALLGAKTDAEEATVACNAATARAESFAEKVVYKDSMGNFPSVGDEGAIYIARDENAIYRFINNIYVCIGRDWEQISIINSNGG